MDEDNKTLFDASHANTFGSSASGGVSIANVSAGQNSLRQQKGLDGFLIGLKARYIAVPSALETQALQICRSNFAPQANIFEAENPFKGTLLPVVEPQLDAYSTTVWYVFPTNIYRLGRTVTFVGNRHPE